MSLEGPQLRYARTMEADEVESAHERALRLAREIEELLEQTHSLHTPAAATGVHSTRIARAMAASLVDELQALVRGGGGKSSLA